VYTSCYCAKKELFEQKEYVKEDIAPTGTKYTVVDVNKATQAILKYFGEKDNVNITITKILSIFNSSDKMTLKMFVYNPIRNIINGYTIDVKIPLSKKTEASVISATPFTEDTPEPGVYKEKQNYRSLNLNEGKFT
jgi:hypothetical protein